MNDEIVFGENFVRLNKYISLKLENNQTNLYVCSQLFRQCKSLIIQIPLKDMDKYRAIKSIDEIDNKILSSENNNKVRNQILSPSDEFWGHCSNLQTWIENDYNTNLLHYSLAFPLLRELYKLGDKKAKTQFKKELMQRFFEGTPQLKNFLLEEGFLNDFSDEERELINIELENLFTPSYFINKYFPGEQERPLVFDLDEINELIGMKVHPRELSKCFTVKIKNRDPIRKISEIKELNVNMDYTSVNLIHNCISEIQGLERLTYLRELTLNYNNISEIKNLEALSSLKYL